MDEFKLEKHSPSTARMAITRSSKTKSPSPPPPPPPKHTKRTESYVTYYLLAYNALSALAWTYILFVTLVHVLNPTIKPPSHQAEPIKPVPFTFARLLSNLPFFSKLPVHSAPPSHQSRIPPFFHPLFYRASTTYPRIGLQTAFIQTFAVLEVAHVWLKWVRSPLKTTAMQVASRLFLVWGITERFETARTNPLYATMVLAWSATEVIRYSFYASSLADREYRGLQYLRYTTFYVLYPLGAASEAFLIYSTLPCSSPIPGIKSWVPGVWHFTDYARALFFVIWWPGLYVMYTYMIQTRRKVLANNGEPKAKSH